MEGEGGTLAGVIQTLGCRASLFFQWRGPKLAGRDGQENSQTACSYPLNTDLNKTTLNSMKARDVIKF